MRNEGLAALVAILVLASVGIGYLSGSGSAKTVTSVSIVTMASTTTSTATETSVFSRGILVPISSASALNPATGLSLNLNLSTNSNAQVVVTAYEFNTLDRVDSVSYGSSWPSASLFQWTQTNCYSPGMEGYAVLQGNYGSNNFTDGQALWLQPRPGPMVQCGLTTSTEGNSSYVFQPLSSRDILSETCVGYWIQGETYTPFTPGTYTVLAGDQWGEVAILHFAVAG